ncbi:MAG: hypothetical protein BIFFINMI_01079 [Phycisphaerae bacterium]|nr:hypothetical protein [Phycisphaerae bacterium]
MNQSRRRIGVYVSGLLSLIVLLAPSGQARAVLLTASFDDPSFPTGDLNAQVKISDTTIALTTAAYATSTTYGNRGLLDADKELYNYGGGGYGAGNAYSGGDKAVINSFLTYDDVVVSAVIGLTTAGTYYGAEAAGVCAGVAAAGGSGYLLYLADAWWNGNGYFVNSSNTGGLLQLVLTRKDAGMNTPLHGATLFDTATLMTTGADAYSDVANFIRLTVSGNEVTGEVWLNQTDDAGTPDATVSFTDPNVLSGHVGAYVAIGHYGSNVPGYNNNYGVAAVDDFQAVELTAAPEPTTLAFLAIGGAALAARRVRRHRTEN